MILAAGRGERMRPLTDHTPKPLLMVGSKPLIAWQIERLVAASIKHIVINHAWLGEQFAATLGNGERFGCTLYYSAETTALETAGGIIQALPMLHDSLNAQQNMPFIVVSGDIYTEFDYASLHAVAAKMQENKTLAHLVMVENPPYNLHGDMVFGDDVDQKHWTYGNIAVFSPQLFLGLPAQKLKLFPWLYTACGSKDTTVKDATIAGRISGEIYTGIWENVGTPSQLQNLQQRF